MQRQMRRNVNSNRCVRGLDTIRETSELDYQNGNTYTNRSVETTTVNNNFARNQRLNVYCNAMMPSTKQPNVSESSEILTPFQATEGIKIRQPSYWVGCSYVHRLKSNRLVLTIRQTGVAPRSAKDKQVSKLKAHIFLISKSGVKKSAQSVVLLESSHDKSFKSKNVTFKNLTAEEVKSSEICIRISSHKWFSKNELCAMKFSLQDCKPVIHKTEWCRVGLSQ